MTPAEIKTLLRNYSDPIAAGLRLNAAKFVAAAKAFALPPPVFADTTPPTVSITTPEDGSVVSRVLPITAIATDNTDLAAMSIYVDNVQLCSGTVAGQTNTLSCNWNTRKALAGRHVITARAMDASGNAALSSQVAVTK